MSDHSMIDDIIANDPEMLESFVKESKDCLSIAESDLKYLLTHTKDPEPERLESAFRSVHSLKSAAGFLGLGNVAELALNMEKLLGNIRSGTLSSDVRNLNPLLKGLEVLNAMLQNITASSKIETKPILALLSERMPSNDVE